MGKPTKIAASITAIISAPIIVADIPNAPLNPFSKTSPKGSKLGKKVSRKIATRTIK